MNATDQLSRLTTYVGRLLEDEYIQDQLGQALSGLRNSSRRAKGHSASEAIKDRRLRSQLLDAARSLTEAARALKQPEPPERHPVRRGLLLTAAVGAAAWALKKRSTNQTR